MNKLLIYKAIKKTQYIIKPSVWLIKYLIKLLVLKINLIIFLNKFNPNNNKNRLIIRTLYL
jgi:hypothetical protein